jgi:hypothetical protein
MEPWRRYSITTTLMLAAVCRVCIPRSGLLNALLPWRQAVSVGMAAWLALPVFLFAAFMLYSTRPRS